jgi:hypothetical protein
MNGSLRENILEILSGRKCGRDLFFAQSGNEKSSFVWSAFGMNYCQKLGLKTFFIVFIQSSSSKDKDHQFTETPGTIRRILLTTHCFRMKIPNNRMFCVMKKCRRSEESLTIIFLQCEREFVATNVLWVNYGPRCCFQVSICWNADLFECWFQSERKYGLKAQKMPGVRHNLHSWAPVPTNEEKSHISHYQLSSVEKWWGRIRPPGFLASSLNYNNNKLKG